jgi:hypothetical protein
MARSPDKLKMRRIPMTKKKTRKRKNSSWVIPSQEVKYIQVSSHDINHLNPMPSYGGSYRPETVRAIATARKKYPTEHEFMGRSDVKPLAVVFVIAAIFAGVKIYLGSKSES